MTVVGANPKPGIEGVEPQPGKSNYLLGNDPSKWLTDVSHYGRVDYTGVYSGINLSYYGNGRQLEYDWIVNPGANPRSIRMRYEGVRRLRVDQNGDLLLETASGSLRHRKPLIFQDRNGKRERVEGRFVVRGRHEVGFEVAPYDGNLPLAIDPVLAYSTFMGGSGIDAVNDAAVDSGGNAYLTGWTDSLNFPTQLPIENFHPGQTCPYSYYSSTMGPITVTPQPPCFDMFVSKLNAAGTALVYSTFIGGSLNDFGYRVRVDASGNAYVAGYSSSTDFPTLNAYQSQLNNSQSGVLLELNSTGQSLIFSTYFGGSGSAYSDFIYGMTIDTTGIYLTGTTQDPAFPMVNSLYSFNQPENGTECYASKFDLSATTLIYSTFIAGTNCRSVQMTVDGGGNAYIVGAVLAGLPTTANALQPKWTYSSQPGCNPNGSGATCQVDGFLLELNSSATGLVYSTYLGGDDLDEALGVSLDSAGNMYVSGYTFSPQNYGGVPFKTTPGSYQPNRLSCQSPTNCPRMGDAFVAIIAPSGSLTAATYLGGTETVAVAQNYNMTHRDADANSVVPDPEGNVFVGGTTVYTNFPSVSAVQPINAGGQDVFVLKFDPALSTVLFSTYFGGSGDDGGYMMTLDANDSIYIVGRTTSPTSGVSPFPSSAQGSPLQPQYGGGIGDGYIVKLANADLSLSLSPPVAATALTRAPKRDLKLPHRLNTQSNPVVVSPSGTINLTATILNDMTVNAGFGADNPGLMIPGLPGHNTLSSCTYGSGNSCLDPNNPNTVKILPGTTLAPGESMNVNLGFTLDGTLQAGNLLTWSFYTHSDTNDPNTANNYASLSAMIGVPVVLQTVPPGLQIIVDGGSPSTTPTTVYLSPSDPHTYCAVTPLIANGVEYTFANWSTGANLTEACQSYQLLNGGTITASYASTPLFSVSGQVPFLKTALSGVVVTLSGSQSGSVITNGSGDYSFTLPKGGNYTLTPALNGYSFTPASLTFNDLSANQTATFTARMNLALGPPFGSFDTPTATNLKVSGSVGFTGWALSPSGITSVDIWRDPNPGEAAQSNGLVYIGTANLVAGSRTDVQKLYPAYPENGSAGWGYLMLTNELPSNGGNSGVGNGTFQIHALAHDYAGNTTDLGTKMIVVDNNSAMMPFGAIDTPTQGGTESGTFVNFGWALTPQPASIPTNGSTIIVYIDNVPVGNPVYNQPRSDIETLFPGYANTDGAIGYLYIDTTRYANGVHMISWVATDSAGHASGIGSRFFTIQN